jgi:hypothetical protein
MKSVLKIEFDSQDLLEDFVAWFSNSGEQGYFEAAYESDLAERIVRFQCYGGDLPYNTVRTETEDVDDD